MSQLNSIRIQNLRSLTDTKTILLKPLTVLVGKNSVGKSTFARTFPLLRQSCEAPKRSPILWYGKFVDFGDFNTALNKKNQDDGITFTLNFTISYNEYFKIFGSGVLYSKFIKRNEKNNSEQEKSINITISINIINTRNNDDPQY
ncbi:TPA: AAA family ATPase, partial [Acinetobacter baumannii]|nr:AAA family ATPase [Acinetobacter baumannii]